MPQTADLDFWEQLDNYEANVISVFEAQNPLTQLLENYPDRESKEIIDFGCGTGNSIPFIDGFKKVYAVDFSKNMLSKAKSSHGDKENIEFIQGDLMTAHIKPVDVILAVSSVMPQTNGDFHNIIDNFRANLKHDGEIIMVVPSFESHSLLYQIKVDYMASQGASIDEMRQMLIKAQMDANYNPLGYIKTATGMIQKHWLKSEIEYRVRPFEFNSINIEKLALEWSTQFLNHGEFMDYPKQWFWIARIKI